MPTPLVRSRLWTWGLPLLLLAVTAITFLPSLANDFVDWDDNVNLLKNPAYRGLGWAQLHWDFTNVLMGHYIPITWLTFSVDYALWGMRPFGYHLTNVVLHVANALLFYLVTLRLLAFVPHGGDLARRLGAAAAALLFAIHPLRAESVAWATERRDVLSGFFFLLTVLGYFAATGASGRRRTLLLGASVGAFALGLGSKSIVMTLPLVLIALDLYPLRRLTLRRPFWPAQRAVIVEKVPYVALAVLGAGVSYYAVSVNHFLTSFDEYPWPARIAMGLYSGWFYVTSTLLPFGLGPVYELPARVDLLAPMFLVPTVVVLALTALVVLLRRRSPWALTAWGVYLVILAPAAGIIHSGHQLAHDRYSYLSCLPFAVLLGAAVVAVSRVVAGGQLRRSIAVCGAGALAMWLGVLAVMTWGQVQIWRDTETLWAYAIDSEPTCAVCHGNFGVHLGNKDNVVASVYHLERAVSLRPGRASYHTNLALQILKLRRFDDAVRHLDVALRLDPSSADALTVLGVALLTEGRPRAALGPLRHALNVDASHVIARTNYGTALARVGDDSSAIRQYRRAIATDPETAPPRSALAILLARRGQIDEALVQYEVVKRLDPRLAETLARHLNEAW
jgi:Flp pilus assembly protein TadD